MIKEVDMEALDMIDEAYDEVERTEVMEHFDMADDGRDLRFDLEDVTDAALSGVLVKNFGGFDLFIFIRFL